VNSPAGEVWEIIISVIILYKEFQSFYDKCLLHSEYYPQISTEFGAPIIQKGLRILSP